MRIALIILILLTLAAGGFSANSYLQNRGLKSRIDSTEEILKKAKKSSKETEKKLTMLQNKNEQIRADSVSILNQNTRLQNELRGIKKKLEETTASLEEKETDVLAKEKQIEKLQKQGTAAEEELLAELEEQKKFMKDELKQLQRRQETLNLALTRERALYHYNLGVALSQAGSYREAIGEYKDSLKYEKNNPEAHYNLGVLYENIAKDKEQAFWHYTRYLTLRPEAKDKEEVKLWIRRLEDAIEHFGPRPKKQEKLPAQTSEKMKDFQSNISPNQ